MYRIKTSDNHVNYFGALHSWTLGLRAVHLITYKSIESYSSILWFVINIPNCFCNSQESVLFVCVFVCLYSLKGLWWCYRPMVTVVAAGLDIVQFPQFHSKTETGPISETLWAFNWESPKFYSQQKLILKFCKTTSAYRNKRYCFLVLSRTHPLRWLIALNSKRFTQQIHFTQYKHI